MYLCIRVDLDYVPWDTPDAVEYGHGEPAMLLRTLELAKTMGLKLHFFASNRVLRAFPATAEVVLGEGHDLDWLCKHPENAAERFAEATRLFAEQKNEIHGLALKAGWPEDSPGFPGLENIRFISGTGSSVPGIPFFPVEFKSIRQASKTGLTARAWTDSMKKNIRDCATRDRGMTLSVRPQVMAKYDPKLIHLKEIAVMAKAVEIPVVTLRQLVSATK